jgi:hypothetical protein
MTAVLARLMWLAPALLLVIGLWLIQAGIGQKHTLDSGVLLTADVVDINIRNRADVTYGHIDLDVPEPSGDTVRVRLPLPLSLLMSIEGQPRVDIRLLEGSEQPIVIEAIARAQWKLSLINASMCLLGAMLLAWGVFAWNRYLRKSGDPGAA